jgi:hypothetical protein
MKKAYIVNFNIATRVIVDTEVLTKAGLEYLLVNKGREQILSEPQYLQLTPNDMEYHEDTEVPFGTLSKDYEK